MIDYSICAQRITAYWQNRSQKRNILVSALSTYHLVGSFYVAITRAKVRTWVLYDARFPSVFVDEFLRPEKVTEDSYAKHPNANKRWTRRADQFLLTLHREGKSIRYIAEKMGRSQTSIVMRLGKLESQK